MARRKLEDDYEKANASLTSAEIQFRERERYGVLLASVYLAGDPIEDSKS